MAILLNLVKSLFWGGVTKRMITHKKLQPLQCYNIFSDSRDVYLSKNCYEHYSPRMVPVAEISGSGSWHIMKLYIERNNLQLE